MWIKEDKSFWACLFCLEINHNDPIIVLYGSETDILVYNASFVNFCYPVCYFAVLHFT